MKRGPLLIALFATITLEYLYINIFINTTSHIYNKGNIIITNECNCRNYSYHHINIFSKEYINKVLVHKSLLDEKTVLIQLDYDQDFLWKTSKRLKYYDITKNINSGDPSEHLTTVPRPASNSLTTILLHTFTITTKTKTNTKAKKTFQFITFFQYLLSIFI